MLSLFIDEESYKETFEANLNKGRRVWSACHFVTSTKTTFGSVSYLSATLFALG